MGSNSLLITQLKEQRKRNEDKISKNSEYIIEHIHKLTKVLVDKNNNVFEKIIDSISESTKNEENNKAQSQDLLQEILSPLIKSIDIGLIDLSNVITKVGDIIGVETLENTLEKASIGISSATELKGDKIAIGSNDGSIKCCDSIIGRCFDTLPYKHEGIVTDIKEMPNGDLITASTDKTIRRWRDKKCIKVIEGHSEGVNCLVVIGEKGRFASGGSTDGEIIIWDLDLKNDNDDYIITCSLKGHDGGISCLKYFENTGFIASGSYDHHIRFWNVDECFAILVGHNGVIRDIIQLKNFQLLSSSDDKTIKLWDTYERQVLHTVNLFNYSIQNFVHHNDNNFIISGCSDGSTILWAIRNNTITFILSSSNDRDNPITGLVKLKDGRLLTTSSNGTMKTRDFLAHAIFSNSKSKLN